MPSDAHAGDLLIENIGTLVAVPPGPLCGNAMRQIALIRDAVMIVRDGAIAWFGEAQDAAGDAARGRNDQLRGSENIPRLDARGGCVLPGLIDCHTHIPFSGDRAAEFERRINGESYLSIMQTGGGIQVTSDAVRRAGVAELVALNRPRLDRMLANGVTTVECKSGYGLSPEQEIKQLEAIAELGGTHVVELVPTYLAAHAVPREFAGQPEAYLDLVYADDVLATIRDHGLARFCDAFCDRGAFDVPQTRRALEAAARFGMRPKLHADELAQIGASALAGELGAISADHLERIDDAGIAAMRAAGTVAVVLPGTSFFLGIAHAPARRMIEAGLAVAVATDCNPGSCMIESLPLVMNIACCQLRMTPLEVVAACTANAAAAIGLHNRKGAIRPGFDADLIVLDAADPTEWLYTPGRDRVRAVVKRGRIVPATD